MFNLKGLDGGNWRAAAPALFLLLAAALGGLRDFAGWTAFSAVFALYLLGFERDSALSLTLPLGLLAAWLAAGLYFSPEPLNGFWHYSRYLVFLAFFAFARARGAAAAGPWAAAAAALAGLAALFALLERGLGAAPAGVIGANPNYGAAFMAAALAWCAASWPDRGLRPRLAWCGAVILFAAGILAANSRGALLAAAAGSVFVLRLTRGWRPALLLAGALLLAAALLPGEQLARLFKLDDPRSLERLSIWRTALEAAAARPVFGFGLGLFERVFEAFKFPYFNGVSYYGHSTLHAHCELLNLAAEAGLPAAALLFWAWASGVLGGRAGAPSSAPLKAADFALFAQASLDVVFYSGAVQLFFFGTLGLLAPAPAKRPGPARWPWVFAAALLAAVALRGNFEREKPRALASGAGLREALRYAPGDAELRKSALSAALRAGNYPLAAALADDAALRYPKDPFLASAAAEAYFAGGDPGAAEKRLRAALALEPGFQAARLGLAQALAARKDAAGAAAERERLLRELAARRPAPRAAYDRALLALPGPALEEIAKWKKKGTGGNTASPRKRR